MRFLESARCERFNLEAHAQRTAGSCWGMARGSAYPPAPEVPSLPWAEGKENGPVLCRSPLVLQRPKKAPHGASAGQERTDTPAVVLAN